MRRACRQAMTPDTRSQHIDLHAARLDTYVNLKAEVERSFPRESDLYFTAARRVGSSRLFCGSLVAGG